MTVLPPELIIVGRVRKAHGIRGEVVVELLTDEPDAIFAPRGKHSAKPDESYRKIERLCDGPRLELFARRRFSPEWAVWGNEAPAEAA